MNRQPFNSRLKYERIGKSLYRLLEDFYFKTDAPDCVGNDWFYIKDGIGCAKKGFVYDGSSIPFKNFLHTATFGKYEADRYSLIASLVHDGFYQLMREKQLDRKYRAYADSEYMRICLIPNIDGKHMNKFQA